MPGQRPAPVRPATPLAKLKGAVERANRTHTEDFYELYDGPWTVVAVQAALRQWEHTYNTVRPHQALGYRTPAQRLAEQARARLSIFKRIEPLFQKD